MVRTRQSVFQHPENRITNRWLIQPRDSAQSLARKEYSGRNRDVDIENVRQGFSVSISCRILEFRFCFNLPLAFGIRISAVSYAPIGQLVDKFRDSICEASDLKSLDRCLTSSAIHKAQGRQQRAIIPVVWIRHCETHCLDKQLRPAFLR